MRRMQGPGSGDQAGQVVSRSRLHPAATETEKKEGARGGGGAAAGRAGLEKPLVAVMMENDAKR